MQALGHIYNVLIILAITLLMALATTVIAYFVDLLPSVINNEAQAILASFLKSNVAFSAIDE